MHSFAPLRKTYSPVSSSLLSSSDETPRGDQELGSASHARSSKLGPRTIHRHSFIIRLIIFVLLEFGFISLVSAALRKPIILHLSFTIIEVKGAVTAIAILWHALAVYAVKDILINIFSAEWIKQDDGSSSLTLQELDIVSRLTTGFVDQGKHFVSKRATASFRLGFLSLLLLMLLNGIGPSAIGTNLVSYNYPSNISVANLTVGVGPSSLDNSLAVSTVAHYGSSIVQVETMGTFTAIGYRATQPNILIPWPSSGAMTTMTYESDVIRYNFSCSWIIPSVSKFAIPAWKTDDQWVTYDVSPAKAKLSSTIYPLSTVNITPDGNSLIYSNTPTTKPITYFIFLGGKGTKNNFLNLEDIPSLVVPCNTTIHGGFLPGQPGPLSCEPLWASFLECDPKLEVLPATINATASSLEATILSGSPTVKNIPIEAAKSILSSNLCNIISEDPLVTQSFNAISRRLFLSGLQHDFVKPLSLREINQNMNNMSASSAKAYLGGYTPGNGLSLSPSLATVNTSAIIEVQKMALVGSKPFLVASSAIIGLLVVLLGVLTVITRPDHLECFELETIIKRLQLNYFSSSDT